MQADHRIAVRIIFSAPAEQFQTTHSKASDDAEYKQYPHKNKGVDYQVADIIASKLNRSFSFYDNWTDPVIGLRGRFNLNKAFYLTAQTDVGGFGIGSDIAVEVYAALGCQFTRNIFSEVGYRYYYDDFRDGNFLYQLSLHGAQITVGLTF